MGKSEDLRNFDKTYAGSCFILPQTLTLKCLFFKRLSS